MPIFQIVSFIISLDAMDFTTLMLPAGRSSWLIFAGEKQICVSTLPCFGHSRVKRLTVVILSATSEVFKERFPICVDLHIEK